LTIRFEVPDSLARPAAGTKVRFSARLVRRPAPVGGAGLRGDQFAYALNGPDDPPCAEDLDEDERLLIQADPEYQPVGPAPEEQAARLEAEAVLNRDGVAEHALRLPDGWRRGPHAVAVEALFTDAMGHEERRTRTLPLESAADTLRLKLEKTTFHPDEVIQVRALAADGAAP
jgi:hypothetical protein